MRIAVASQNFRTVTGHAGKTRRFLVFEIENGGPPREVERLDLPREMTIHAFRSDGPHPLDAVAAVIAGSAGPGFVDKMAARGVTAVATTEQDPVAAVVQFLAGTLPPAPPHDHDCDHDHEHEHEQDHPDGTGDHDRASASAQPAAPARMDTCFDTEREGRYGAI
ncbi:putative Fe-Mo cluster-binding NifX family protein [Rhodoplanes tepidamans]|uniref:NifB/NifX family molybdenum-iron cluster-binding protein n=1 Tax=Rhodoplanes TaxID=29407 RepID=UPI0027849A01|nr:MULTISPECIES: NifB/NifX family molybdenum-iron cluster-binding protein [Rhodoplanes]MDQ0355948.1 putative Fe-Mo cluster-binding NifX family protein [Rhodoplanes tepidamans]